MTPNAPVTEVQTKPAADNAVASTSWQDDASQNEALDDPAFSPRKCLQVIMLKAFEGKICCSQIAFIFVSFMQLLYTYLYFVFILRYLCVTFLEKLLLL